MKNKLEEILNFVCDYKFIIFFIILIAFIFLGIKYTFWFTILYVILFGIVLSFVEKDTSALFVLTLSSTLICWLCVHIFFNSIEATIIKEIKTEKNIKLLDNEVILFDDMSTLNDEKIYYKCLAYNCKKIVKTETIKGYKGYNDLFYYSEYSTDINN